MSCGLAQCLFFPLDAGPKCECIIHRVFTGALQSDVTCSACETVSTTIDPFWDVSLDIRPHHSAQSPMKPAAPKGKGKAQFRLDPKNQTTLEQCIERYTRAESLMAEIMCSKCNHRHPATKQMVFSKLPAVMCFHLKRFEHEMRAAKISTSVRFPETLDMRPYLAQNPADRASGAAAPSTKRNYSDIDDSYIYILFAVVNHYGTRPLRTLRTLRAGFVRLRACQVFKRAFLSDTKYSAASFCARHGAGTLQNGHYTVFVHQADANGQWFLCDDETVSMATLPEVLASEGYMLFYVKKRLEYSI